MSSIATQFEEIDADEWTERILALFPEPWSDYDARLVGGILHALVKAAGGEFEVANKNLRYVLSASRLNTASGEALDRAAFDFFGPTPVGKQEIIRTPGESDESLRNRIAASLLLPLGTRESMRELIRRLTGQEPRIIEPWNLLDTSAYEAFSYFDVDTVQNPARYSDPAMRYQAVIESITPSFGGQGQNPVWCFDAGAAYDSPSGYFIDARSSWFITIRLLDQLISKVKVFGTTIWRKYRSQPLTSWALSGTKFVNENSYMVEIEVYPPFSATYSVLARANWNTEAIVQPINNSKFRLFFSTPAPADAFVDWNAAPITVPGYATFPVIADSPFAEIAVIPELQGRNIFVSPNWNTPYWLDDSDQTEKVINFATPPPLGASLSYAFFPSSKSGWISVAADSIQAIIPIQAQPPYQAFVMPTWNTSCPVTKAPDHIAVNLTNPPSEESKIYYCINES